MRSSGRRGRRRGARNRRVTAWRERRREGRRPRRGGSPTPPPMRPDDDSEAGREAGGAGSARGRSSLPRSAVLLPELRGRGRHKEGRGRPDPGARDPLAAPEPAGSGYSASSGGRRRQRGGGRGHAARRIQRRQRRIGGAAPLRRGARRSGGATPLRGGARRSGRAAPSCGQEAEVTGDKKRKRPPRARGPARSAARAGAGARGRWCRWRRAVARWAAGDSVGLGRRRGAGLGRRRGAGSGRLASRVWVWPSGAWAHGVGTGVRVRLDARCWTVGGGLGCNLFGLLG